MSTQAYYKDRLGFDPREGGVYDGPAEKYRKTDNNKPHGYEENLTKFKDERDAVQKKTFTKWVNKHLKKANRQIRDLFEDLRDGHNLISLLEVLTGEQLPRERGQMRFHMLHNIDTALHFLHCKKIKLVNIRSEDIVDGNPKLTLGLIWTIILHFQISDIVVGQEPNVSAKDYLLRWAKRTTHKYPGVHIQDFSKSWRDGLAFSAIIHRNRPDLIDWRAAKNQRVRERIETAFHVVEKEYGVTRLLDPEDVDTHEPDEKSLITYISSLHEVFPEPPAIHPLYDSVAQQRVQEYRELASSLHIWIREKFSLMQDRSFPPTLIEMKKLATESTRFRNEELPPRARDKNYLSQLYRELEKYFKTIGEIDVEPELRIENIERNWTKLMSAYQERDRHIIEEIKRMEKMQRLAEKVHREIKQNDSALDTIEINIESESRRIERLHPLEAKKIADQLDSDLAIIENNIQGLKTDVNTLRNGRYSQAGDLDKRVNKLHEKWVNIRRLLHNKILQPLANLSFPIEERTITKHVRTVQETRNVDTNPHFMTLQEHIEWCKKKLKQLRKSEYGNDLPSVQTERDLHVKEHRQIEQFHTKLDACIKARSYFNGEELSLYNQHLGALQKIYAELISFSTNRMNDLETLLDFVQSATKELQWLNEKEEEEITRDWSDIKLNVNSLEKHFERLMSEFEKREIQISSVQERGEILVLQNHPGSKAIEAYMAGMQAQWAWLLQLTHCLETHSLNTRNYQNFFKDITTAEEWLKEKDEVMNSEFSQGDFSLDVGERLLQGMQAVRDELNSFGDQVQALTLRAQDIFPLKQRRQPVTRPLTVKAICNYKQNNFSVEKNKECTLLDNSGRIKWRVHNEKGVECQVPGVCFVIPPPDKEALDAADRLRRQYDRSIALWQKKQLRMRQNMIFATIKVVKGWDLPQFIAIGAEQRNAIRRALNEDADKLMAEGDPSDPQLRRLRREMDEVNRLFDEFEKRARAEEESKNQTRIFNNQISTLQVSLDEFERIINQRVLAPLPRDIDTLQHMVLEHKEFESRLQNVEPEIEACKDTFRSITLKTPQHKKDLERVLDKWKYIWNTSNLYIERLKCVEIVLLGMDDASQVISEFENKLALFEELPSTQKGLEAVHDDLLRLQSAVGQQQIAMDQLNDDFDNTRRLTEKSRPNTRGPHSDIERMDKEIQKMNTRWANVCSQLAERLRGCEQAYNLLKNYKTAKTNEDSWLDEQYGKFENLEPLKVRAKDNLEATRNLLNSVVERAPIIEQVNVNGGRFIREGKIWSKGLQKYREVLLEDQPSLDAEFFRNQKIVQCGTEQISQELDEFNGKYQNLINRIYGRLQEIAVRCPGDIVTLRLVEQMQPQPFRTFRSEFHMSSASETTSTFTTTTHYTQQYVKTRTNENGSSATTKNDELGNSTSNGKQIRNIFDGISETHGIINPYTGQVMTVREAIISRILDVRTGCLTTPDGTLNIDEAVENGLIDRNIAFKLQNPCGIHEDGNELTLLQAIQREIHEAEFGKNPTEKLKVNQQQQQQTEIKLQTGAISLTDALNQGLVDEKTGWIVDRNTGNKYQIDAAIKTNVLDGNLREIVDPTSDYKLTLNQAIEKGIINPKLGKYVVPHEKFNFHEAKRRNFIVKPKTISELFDEELIDENCEIFTPLRLAKVTLDESITNGVLDYEKLNCILDFRSNELITLKDAINSGIISKNSFKNLITSEIIQLKEAVNRGYIISVVKKSVFDVAAFRYQETFLSFNEAISRGFISQNSNGSLLIDTKSGQLIPFSDAVNSGHVKAEVYDLLTQKIGIHVNGNELNVLQAVFTGFINPKNGNLHDNNRVVYLNEAISKNLITPEGAAMLNSLLNLTVSTKVTHRLVQRYVTVTKKNIEKTTLSYTEALRLGLIDNENQNFTLPDTETQIPIVQAISEGILVPDSQNSNLTLNYDLPRDGWKLFDAIQTKKFNPEDGMFVITGTDRLTSFEECIRLKIIDPNSALVLEPNTNRKHTLNRALDKKILDKTGRYNDEMNMAEAIKNALIFENDQGVVETSKLEKIISKTIELPEEMSEGDKTRARITLEPTYQVKIGRAKSSTSKYEPQRVVLQKLRRKIVKPEDALQTGIIDEETARILNTSPETLSQAINSNKINPESGRIIDPQRGDTLDIQTAITRGILDLDGSNELLFPLNRSLSIPELLGQGLLDLDARKVVHPETGSYLSLSEAITCDILDPLSTLNKNELTLRKALEIGVISDETHTVRSKNCEFNISEAVDAEIFDENVQNGPEKIPKAGMTFETALKRKLVDTKLKEITHPITKEKIPVEIAIKNDFIMSLPFPPNTDCINLSEALNLNLINEENATFKSPKNGDEIPISEALESGILTIKETEFSTKPITTITETNNTIHRVTTRTIELKQGFKLLNLNEIQNISTLEIIPIEEARKIGIIISENEIQNITKFGMNFSDALNKGLVDMNAGTFINPSNGSKILIQDALKNGTLNAVPKTDETIKNSELNISEAFDVIYNEKINKFIDPNTNEKLTFAEAVEAELIDPNSMIYNVSSKKPLSIENALQDGLLDEHGNICTTLGKFTFPQAAKMGLIAVLGGSTGISTKKIQISRNLTAKFLSELGYYDMKSRHFTDLNGAFISFETLIYDSDIFEPDNILIKDLSKKPISQYISLNEALSRPLIDRNTGHMVDPKTGKRVKFFEAVKLRWIIDVADKPKEKYQAITLEELIGNPRFNPQNVTVTNDDNIVPLNIALTSNIVDAKSVSVKDPKTGQYISYYEGIDGNLIDIRRGLIGNLPFETAFKTGLIRNSPRPISLEAFIKKGNYNEETGKFKDALTETTIELNEAISRKLIEPSISLIEDTSSNNFHPLNSETGLNLAKKTNLNVALNENSIRTKPVVYNLIEILISNYYNPRNGKILNPLTGDEITLEQAFRIKLIDPETTRIKDDKRRKILEIPDAIQCNLLDTKKGVLNYPLLSLDQAYAKGYILSTVLPWSLQETLSMNVYNPENGKFTINNSELSLQEAISHSYINPNVLSVKDPRCNDIITLNDAVNLRLIDPVNGRAVDPLTNSETNLIEALDKGLIIPSNTQISLPEAVFKGFYDPQTGKFIDPKYKKTKLKPESAFNRGLVDISSTLVTIDEELVTFEQAIDEGYVNTSDGVVLSFDFNEAFERGVLIEVTPPVPLSEAIYKGIYDEHSGLFLDPRTGNYLTLIEGIEVNLLDIESITFKDTRRMISFQDALHKGYIDGNTSLVKSSGDEGEITLRSSFEKGLLVDGKAAISLQRAIHQGIYDENSGKFIDGDRKITLYEAIRKCVIHPLYPCHFHETTGTVLNLHETCKLSLINKQTGVFESSSLKYKLNEALENGLIIDIETCNFSLYDVLCFGFYNPGENSFNHPGNSRKFNLREACENELVNPEKSLVKIPNGNYVKLPESISSNVINDVENTYDFPNGNRIDLHEAMKKGLIVPCERPLNFERVIECGLHRESGKFIDPNTNKMYDLIEAFNVGLINPATTAFKDTKNAFKTLPTAISEGRIDVRKGRVLDSKTKQAFSYELAFQKNLLVPLENPLEISKTTLLDLGKTPQKIHECTLEEAINFEMINPEIAVLKNAKTGRFITVTTARLDVKKIVTFDAKNLVTYDNSTQIYLKEPLEFRRAVNLKTGRFIDPQSGEFSLKDALTLGLLDPDSAVIKDGHKSKLIKLPEGFRKGLIDSEKGNVVDTLTSKLYPLNVAVDNGLVMVPKRGFSLIDGITYGIYNPTSGGFTDPFINVPIIERKKMNLQDAINEDLIDPTSTVVKDIENGGVVPLLSAIDAGLVNAHSGRIQNSGEELDFKKALDKGLILPAEQRQAFEEKYKLCDETLSKLLHWIGEIEDRIAAQDIIHEFEEDLRNQINTMKAIRDDLETHHPQVTNCTDQIRQLVLTAGEILSKSEVMTLEKAGRNLKNRYDKATDRTDALLKRMLTARDELSKLKSELNIFSDWLGKARRVLEDKERSLSDLKHLDSSTEGTKEFVSDVIAHQADLRFITMSAQKFVDEGKDYLKLLNEFRTSLPSRLPHIEPLTSQESPVRSEVSLVTQQYKDLLNRANTLSNRLSGVGGRQREYNEALEKARIWLRDAEPRAVKILNEPIGADPKSVEDQLSNAKGLNNEFVANGRLIDSAKFAAKNLLSSLEGQISPSEITRIETPVLELSNKYVQLSNAISEKCQELETALIQSQGVQDALDGIITWLNIAETQFKNMQKPASLIKERLDEQIREHRVLQSDLDNHIASVDSVYLSASELIDSSSNARVVKKIEAKLNDVKARFEKLYDRAAKRGEFLGEIEISLSHFNNQTSQFDEWYQKLLEMIEGKDVKMEVITSNVEGKHAMFEEIIQNGKELLTKRDVTDTSGVRDKIKLLENQWRELLNLLDDKQRISKQRAEQMVAYEKLREQVVDWLSKMETRVSRLEIVAIELEILKKQNEELKPISKEYKEYAGTIDKVNDIGMVYENLMRGERPESPKRKNQAYRPSYGRRASNEGRSPSPTKALSPLSTGGSSGFSSRRSSQDGFHLEDLSPIQQQLAEINHRYSLLGVKLTDRQNEIDSLRDEVKKHLDNLKTLRSFLDKVQKQLPKDIVPGTKDEADKLNKQIKQVLEEMYEKQSLLDSTKSQVKDLLKRKPGAVGGDNLNDELEDVVSHWKGISEHLKNRIKFMEDMKEFHDTHDSLNSWLGAKERMLTVLGPISSDSRMVQSQVQQVQVLREEFRSQQPQLQHLIEVGDSVLAYLDLRTPEGQKINNKLANIQQKWADLLSKLEERADSLGAAADTSREFDAQLIRLRDALQGISDNLDELPLDKDPEEQLRKIENLERQLEGQRPLLVDLEAAGAHLCDVLSDPASRADIQGKLASIGRQFNALQKKLDHKKAELEGSLRDGRQFEASCAKTLGWLSDELNSLSKRLLVSADRVILDQQLAHHEPIYRDVLAREHEVIMLLNKGRDILARNTKSDTKILQRELDKIQQHWDKLKKEAVERQTRLQTCKEHCRKYYRALENFLPWLRQAEDQLDNLRPSSYQRKHIEKQLKELQVFRNEVWKKSGEYENTKALGESFLFACDLDTEIVKNELSDLKTRWDKLNNDLIQRVQALEDQLRKLIDFNENLRDFQHGLERCEDKLASHDGLGGAAKDPKLLDRIKALRDETSKLKKPLNSVRQQANDLATEASENGIDSSHLQDEVKALSDRLDDLQAKLDDRCSELQSAATAVTQFNEQVKGLSHDLSSLESELDAMKAPGRDVKTVRSQLDELASFSRKLLRASDDVEAAIRSGEILVDNGFAPDTIQTRQQVESLKKQLGKLDDRSKTRENELNNVLKKLEDFYLAYGNVIENIREASENLRKLKPVGSEVDTIRAQQLDFKKFRGKLIEPLVKDVDGCNKSGQGLIQSASSGVNTSTLEKDLEKMNELWNSLKDKINERDRRLDVGLLQSGKFQEALDGLDKWLTDTEDLVANQKPPSADYKVVKAQLQEQKFLKKMLLDRQPSMTSLFNMGNEIAKEADPAERKGIEKQLKNLMGRFDALSEGAQQRTLDLEQAMKVAKEFQDKLTPIQEWLDRSEKKVKDMEIIPTDEEKIQARIREHDALHSDILNKKPAFRELTDVASNLMSLVGEDEAVGLADKLQEVTDRYGNLVEASENIGELLTASRQGLRHLVLTYQDLAAWMDSLEQRLARYKVLAVHKEKLLEQMDDLTNLTEELASRQGDVDGTVDSGVELMRHISSDEALQLKDKLDSLQRRYNDLTSRGAELLKHAQDMLPLVQQFHENHNKLVDWMQNAELILQSADPTEEDIARLEYDLQEIRPVLEHINLLGPQLAQASPGEGASTIEALVTRDNRRFDAIAEQIQRRAERIHLGKQRALEVTSDIDELLEWFREVEGQIKDAEKPSAEPDLIRVQLKEHKALNDDISSQKSRVRDVLSTAKKVLRETPPNEDTSLIREKMEDLREAMDTVSALSTDRLGILEQALPLAEHFHDTHNVLINWLNDMEEQVSMLSMPALRPDLIAQQQDRNEMFIQSINEHKPLLDKLNKTGEALIRLCNDDDGTKVQELLDSDNDRYAALKLELRQRQQALEEALQESSQFSDKLEGMLRALSNTADAVNHLEPISAHVPKIRDQIEDNDALTGDLDKRKEAYAAVQRAADDVINKAANRADPAIKEIKKKLDKLNKLWDDVQRATNNRGNSLEEALDAAQKFWKELHAIMSTLKDLEDTLASQEPPAVEPKAIQEQQVALQEIRQEIDQTKPEVDQVRSSGQKLMKLVGEPDKPEVKKHIEDLDHAWDNITALYAKREENLIDAMEKAMEFHETLRNLLEFLGKAENKFGKMGPLGADIEAVKKQIDQLKNFKAEVDPHMVKVEALNRQAQELTERTSADQAAAIKEPLSIVNKRWDDLLRGIVERQRQLENALLRLGQFQHALNELLIWIQKTDNTLDELKPVAGDTQILEIELAKLKVLINDIQAHQTSIDTLNDAGRQIIESGEDEASATQDKLNTLNTEWRALMRKAADRQRELEDALLDAQRFNAEIQDLLAWLGDVDGILTASKPVGGLPETASEQLERFMEIYNEIEDNRPKVETVLAQGQEYLKKGANSASNLNHNLRTLKQRWDSVTSRANDKKIKLEIALKEATEFHEALQAFVDWLTNAEKILTNLKPVSRVLETIQAQIEEHKLFQKDVGAHREIMLQLDKKGTHLKYFSQKQDVILIKNLLISVQHRWERVASKSAERTRALDTGYKEAKEFHDAWSNLMNWLEETETSLDELLNTPVGNDPEQIKLKLAKHQEFQRALSSKQSSYDNVMKSGKNLKEKAPKHDEPILKQMLIELKTKWNNVCNKSVDRQRKLEEALLYSGQFKEAIAALMAWLKKVEKELNSDSPVHGDLDTVNHLVELHRQFEKELERRNDQMESVMRTGQELERKANKSDADQLRDQLNDLNNLWDNVSRLSHFKSDKLRDALKEAEKLHMSVNMLLDWLSEAEMKLRFVGNTPEDEATAYEQLRTLDSFRMQLSEKEIEKDRTLELAHNVLAKAHPDSINVIKNWIKVIQARWEEVSQWALQRHKKLTEHMQSLKDLDESLEELIQWLLGLENTLISLKREELPMDIPSTEKLIADHKEFMENTQRRQVEVDRICKARQVKPVQGSKDVKKFAKTKGSIRGSQHDIRETDNYGTLGHKQSRASPGRELSPDPQYPHVGPRFPPSGSEPEFKSPRVKFLYDKWRHVWVLSWERQRELYDHLAYLKEKEKADNFSWDDWRKRFLKFMNYKKSRLTDLFRKMDKDNNELIPRDDFIDGIIKTKFDTSRLEMKHVADMFDLDNRGLIDWKKFIAALRPDWEDKVPNDSQKIHDEVKRLVMLCTCRQKFRVFQVGEGKYRFGDSQKLRLVRILRSTVMVRVGGGWVALDEFLLKNDPCRAKGRTNIELREQFILADGVSQTMTAFKPKTSASSPASGSSASSSLRTPQGPITKVRERSARSVPMGSLPRTSRSSLSAGTPDSLSDNESATFRTPRKASSSGYRSNLTPGGSRPSSRPGSRPGSKPPSRHGSNLSLDSTDDGTPSSRIPRRTPGLSGRTGTTSSTFRKNLNGTASTGTRTPSGLVSPASPVTRSSGIPRASSIPTLTSISASSSRSASKTRQVTVGIAPTLRTSARTRTPSGSNTPVPTGATTAVSRLLRRSSNASDTPTGQARKNTTNNREPFRL